MEDKTFYIVTAVGAAGVLGTYYLLSRKAEAETPAPKPTPQPSPQPAPQPAPAPAPTPTSGSAVKVSIDRAKVSGVLKDFPLKVRLGVKTGTQDVFTKNGEMFTKISATDGTQQLYVEVEKWDTAAKDGVLWIKVPSFPSDITIYYGVAENPGYVGMAGTTPAAKVWDQNFTGVWHLSESGPNYLDSTGGHNTGTGKGGVSRVDEGPSGASQMFNGVNWIEMPSRSGYSIPLGSGSTGLTVNMWMKPKNTTGTQQINGYWRIAGKGDPGKMEWHVGFYSDVNTGQNNRKIVCYVYSPSGGKGAGDQIRNGMTSGVWDMFTFTMYGTDPSHGSQQAYKGVVGPVEDAGEAATTTWQLPVTNGSPITYTPGDGKLRIGCSETAGDTRYNGMYGQVDEFWISNTVRSKEWIDANYYSQADLLQSYKII